MNLKERDRLAVFSQVKDGQMSICEASCRLGVSYRQGRRLYKRYREVGDAGLVHGLRGRASNNRGKSSERRERALALYRERYEGFGPTLASEQMAGRDGLTVDHETLRGWLIEAGLWRVRRDRRRHHRRRPRKACFGELVQLDGSDHAWFGEDHGRCVLMVMVDDATGQTLARFFEAETTEASMTIFQQWTQAHGLPRALYPDRHSIYRRNDKGADEIEHRTGKRPMTRFGEAMDALDVKLICAHSPQAKGRVERMNGTLQDRLVKLLKLEGITTIAAANAYLDQTFLPAHNAKFAVEPADSDDAHRPAPSDAELSATLCPVRERRTVDRSGCVSWRGERYELTGADATPRRRREVTVRQQLDGQVDLLDATTGKTLSHRLCPAQPETRDDQATDPPTLAQRVAPHKGPAKPARDHPWNKSPAVSGDLPARCARLQAAAHRRTPEGTVLLS